MKTAFQAKKEMKKDVMPELKKSEKKMTTDIIAESEHFKASIYTSLGSCGWELMLNRKNEKITYLERKTIIEQVDGDFYFLKHEKDEIVDFLASLSELIKARITRYEESLGVHRKQPSTPELEEK